MIALAVGTTAGWLTASAEGVTAEPMGSQRVNHALAQTDDREETLLAQAENDQGPRDSSKSGNRGKAEITKPNILVIFGDDIGQTNISAYSFGLLGYHTPNIDRLAREGMMFTDYYAEQSCTAGRSSFITGQCTFRTGLSKVGVPGSDIGLQKEDPTLAQLLKSLGYATGQFGKNHLGDLNKYLPTVHGFDTFFGFLYHLNAFEEPEQRNYPRNPKFKAMFGPRNVLLCKATDVVDETVQPRWGRIGKQTIKDMGPLTIKRMETIDDETSDAAVDYIKRQAKAGQPFFCWFNSSRMHLRTHVAKDRRSPPGFNARTEYADGMVEHDGHVGKLLDCLDELGIAENTIVIYTTDNGPHANTWPDAATTPFRSEKDTNWEGAFRAPCLIRWPGKIEAGSISNAIVSGHDWLPTLLAAAGAPNIKEKLLTGYQADGQTFTAHLDGFNQLPYLTGEVEDSPRNGFFYFTDEGDICAVRLESWKIVFLEQRAKGTLRVWAEPFTQLRLPLLFNLRSDPYERANITSNTYYDWLLTNAYVFYAANAATAKFLKTFEKFPPRQKAATFSIEQAMEAMKKAIR